MKIGFAVPCESDSLNQVYLRHLGAMCRKLAEEGHAIVLFGNNGESLRGLNLPDSVETHVFQFKESAAEEFYHCREHMISDQYLLALQQYGLESCDVIQFPLRSGLALSTLRYKRLMGGLSKTKVVVDAVTSETFGMGLLDQDALLQYRAVLVAEMETYVCRYCDLLTAPTSVMTRRIQARTGRSSFECYNAGELRDSLQDLQHEACVRELFALVDGSESGSELAQAWEIVARVEPGSPRAGKARGSVSVLVPFGSVREQPLTHNPDIQGDQWVDWCHYCPVTGGSVAFDFGRFEPLFGRKLSLSKVPNYRDLVSACEGDYVFFYRMGMRLQPEFLRMALRALSCNPELDYVAGYLGGVQPNPLGYVSKVMPLMNISSPLGCVYRKRALDRISDALEAIPASRDEWEILLLLHGVFCRGDVMPHAFIELSQSLGLPEPTNRAELLRRHRKIWSADASDIVELLASAPDLLGDAEASGLTAGSSMALFRLNLELLEEKPAKTVEPVVDEESPELEDSLQEQDETEETSDVGSGDLDVLDTDAQDGEQDEVSFPEKEESTSDTVDRDVDANDLDSLIAGDEFERSDEASDESKPDLDESVEDPSGVLEEIGDLNLEPDEFQEEAIALDEDTSVPVEESPDAEAENNLPDQTDADSDTDSATDDADSDLTGQIEEAEHEGEEPALSEEEFSEEFEPKVAETEPAVMDAPPEKKTCNFQVFWSQGGQFDQAQSYEQTYVEGKEIRLNFEIEAPGSISTIRIDPSDRPGILRLKRVVVRDEKLNLSVFTSSEENGFDKVIPAGTLDVVGIEQDALLFIVDGNDPQLLLLMPAGFALNHCSIEVEFSFKCA